MSNANLISLVHFNEINILLQPIDEAGNKWFTTNTADSSNTITINDILSLEAKFDTFAYKFTDVNNKYYCLTTSDIDVNRFVQNNFNIEFWFKPDMNNLSVSGADLFTIGHRYDNSGEDLFTGLRVSVFYKGIKFTVDQDFITRDKIYVYNIEFDFDTWYHVALTKENDILRFFVNGNIVAAIKYDQEELADLLNSNENKLAFGYIYNDDNHSKFVGAIDEVRILDQAMYKRVNFIPPTEAHTDIENKSTIKVTDSTPDYLSLLHFNNDNEEDALYSPYDEVTKSNWLYNSGEDHIEGSNLSNDNPKFGDSCYKFHNNTVVYYLDTDTAVDNLNPIWLYYNPDGFTLDFWIRLEEDTAGSVLGFYTGYSNGFKFDINENGALVIRCGEKEFVEEVTAYDWHHIAISKVADIIHIFIDGIEVETIDDWDLLFDPLHTDSHLQYKLQTILIGSYTEFMDTKTFTGSIDEFRILNKGIYSENFEVPTEEGKIIDINQDNEEDTESEDDTIEDTTSDESDSDFDDTNVEDTTSEDSDSDDTIEDTTTEDTTSDESDSDSDDTIEDTTTEDTTSDESDSDSDDTVEDTTSDESDSDSDTTTEDTTSDESDSDSDDTVKDTTSDESDSDSDTTTDEDSDSDDTTTEDTDSDDDIISQNINFDIESNIQRDVTVYTDTYRKIKSPYERDVFYLTFNIPSDDVADDSNEIIDHNDNTSSSDDIDNDDTTSEEHHVPMVDEGVTFVKVDANEYAKRNELGYAFPWYWKTKK